MVEFAKVMMATIWEVELEIAVSIIVVFKINDSLESDSNTYISDETCLKFNSLYFYLFGHNIYKLVHAT